MSMDDSGIVEVVCINVSFMINIDSEWLCGDIVKYTSKYTNKCIQNSPEMRYQVKLVIFACDMKPIVMRCGA